MRERLLKELLKELLRKQFEDEELEEEELREADEVTRLKQRVGEVLEELDSFIRGDLPTWLVEKRYTEIMEKLSEICQELYEAINA